MKRSSQVTCRDMDDVISSHTENSALGPQSAAHLVHCARCRSLTNLLDEAVVGDGLRPSEIQLRRIQTDIAADLNRDKRIVWYRVESENFESIHNHSAYALIEKDKRF